VTEQLVYQRRDAGVGFCFRYVKLGLQTTADIGERKASFDSLPDPHASEIKTVVGLGIQMEQYRLSILKLGIDYGWAGNNPLFES